MTQVRTLLSRVHSHCVSFYGEFPDMIEMMAIIRNIYGEDFMQIFERSFDNIDQELLTWRVKSQKKDRERN